MRNRNDYSFVSERAIKQIRQIVNDALHEKIAREATKRLLEELRFHQDTLRSAFDFRKAHGPERSIADSDVYFSEKLSSLMSFAEMAVDTSLHDGGYTPEKITDNVGHYSYLVAKLVAANWTSFSPRPVSDTSIKESSFENREALERLVNR